MTRKQIVLPADVYDTLEFSALVYGGIGKGWYTTDRALGMRGQPLCVYGHAMSAGIGGTELGAADLDPERNDSIVSSLGGTRRKRVSWDDYCREGNIVRGAA